MDFQIYDTTLRDGAQQEGMNLSIADKVTIAGILDDLGVGFIEGGWPGAVPKDTDFFARVPRELTLRNAQLAAFGATRKPGVRAASDPQVLALVDSGAPVITLVAKADIRHVERALRTTAEENVAMVADTVAFLRAEGRRVFVDAEHFYDGYLWDAQYSRAVVAAAYEAGAEVVALCDTNGGMLPDGVAAVVTQLCAALGIGGDHGPIVGMHAHNDSGCAVANTLAAVGAGVRHVQGTVNGYGERTGNADLLAVVANLQLKLGYGGLGDKLTDLTRVSHAISEVTNIAPYARQPYVGASAFAHKAGLHASAIRVDPDLYQHTDPRQVGNDMRMLVSEMAGRASIELKGRELGFDLTGKDDVLARLAKRVKEAEAAGYTFDAADASFELMVVEELSGVRPRFFQVESWRTIVERQGSRGAPAMAEATVKMRARGERIVMTREGNGPVNALDAALRAGLLEVYPQLADFRLVDFKVRILDQEQGTDAITRVLIESTDGEQEWFTVGVGPNILEASWEALCDAVIYGLYRRGVTPQVG